MGVIHTLCVLISCLVSLSFFIKLFQVRVLAGEHRIILTDGLNISGIQDWLQHQWFPHVGPNIANHVLFCCVEFHCGLIDLVSVGAW